MDFDYLVFVGRFEPFHNGHAAAARYALRNARKLIFLIGSADTPRTIRNPWSVAERSVMIQSALEDVADRLILRPLRDHLYNEANWVAAVQREVLAAIRDDGGPADARIGVVGQENDTASHYLHEFPQWSRVEVNRTEALSATELRRYLFESDGDPGKGALHMLQANVPPPVFEMLEAWGLRSWSRLTGPIADMSVRLRTVVLRVRHHCTHNAHRTACATNNCCLVIKLDRDVAPFCRR